jgi:hypothetical protein
VGDYQQRRRLGAQDSNHMIPGFKDDIIDDFVQN